MLAVGTERGEGREASLLAEGDTGDQLTQGPTSTPSPLTPEPYYQHPPNPLPMGGPTPATRLEDEGYKNKGQESTNGVQEGKGGRQRTRE